MVFWKALDSDHGRQCSIVVQGHVVAVLHRLWYNNNELPLPSIVIPLGKDAILALSLVKLSKA
jgi:hypothetical protein